MSRVARALGIHHGREIFALSAPTILAMFSHTLMWTVDTAFLGHVSAVDLAAAGLGGMITWTGYCIFNNLSRITATFVSQANGEGDDAKVGSFTWQGIWVALVCGALLTLAGQESDRVLPLTRNPPEVLAGTYLYIRIRTLSAVATQLVIAVSGFFQGRKDVKTPMYASIAANAANVLLDWILIFGWGGIAIGGRSFLAAPAMGLRGAAIATSVAVFLNAVLLLAAFLLPRVHRERYHVHLPHRPSPRRIRDLVRIGFPASVDTFTDMLAFTVFTSFIGRAGAESLAASQITIQLLSFSFMPMWGITTAATVMVGNAIGEKRIERAERYAGEFLRISLYYTAFLAVLLATLGRPLFHIFTDEAEILVFAGSLAVLAGVFQIFDGMRMITVGILQGAGDTRVPMWITVSVLGAFFLPVTWFMTVARGGTVITAWGVGSVTYLIVAGLLYLRYRRGVWKGIRIFSESGASVGEVA
jgi:MATE family multidrug resistance protein